MTTSQIKYPVLIPARVALRQLQELIDFGDVIHAVHRKTSRSGAETWDFFVLGMEPAGPFIRPIGAKMASALQLQGFGFAKTFVANNGLTLSGREPQESGIRTDVEGLLVQMLSGLLFGRADGLRCSRV